MHDINAQYVKYIPYACMVSIYALTPCLLPIPPQTHTLTRTHIFREEHNKNIIMLRAIHTAFWELASSFAKQGM